jgi:hypothetical protein
MYSGTFSVNIRIMSRKFRYSHATVYISLFNLHSLVSSLAWDGRR